MKVKVCGITTLEQMNALQSMGIEYAGMIFYEGSKRFAGEKLANDKHLIRNTAILKIGVFVNADIDTIENAIEDYGLWAVQLHGSEPPEVCSHLMEKVTVIKAFPIAMDTDIDLVITPYQNACTYFLFDRATEEHGGSGKKFDWSKLSDAKVGKQFFLSGGIAPEDGQMLASFKHPFLYAVDVNSRFEVEPGVKNLESIRNFYAQLVEW